MMMTTVPETDRQAELFYFEENQVHLIRYVTFHYHEWKFMLVVVYYREWDVPESKKGMDWKAVVQNQVKKETVDNY